MSVSRFVRIAITLAVLVGAVVVLYPRVFSEIRSNGTINARLIVLQAPIGGVLVRDLPDIGDTVTEGEVLTRIIDDTESKGLTASLNVDRELLATRAKALAQRLLEIQALGVRLQERVENYGKETVANIRLRVTEAEARIGAWRAVMKERSLMFDRQKTLLENGSTTKVRVEQAESLYQQAREEHKRAQADTQRLKQELSAAGQGVFVAEGKNDVPYSQQRLDEVVISITELQVQLKEAESRLVAVDRQLTDEILRADRRENVEIRSPIDGIIWRKYFATNSVVTKNNSLLSLLDCRRLFVEVAVPESVTDKLEIGQEVRVRFQGTENAFSAKVKEVRGTRSVTTNNEFAAAPPLLKKDESLLIAEWQETLTPALARNFCHVGRRAEVTLTKSALGDLKFW